MTNTTTLDRLRSLHAEAEPYTFTDIPDFSRTIANFDFMKAAHASMGELLDLVEEGFALSKLVSIMNFEGSPNASLEIDELDDRLKSLQANYKKLGGQR